MWDDLSSLCASVKEEIKTNNKDRRNESYNLQEEINYHLINSWITFPDYPSTIEQLIEKGKSLKRAGELLHEYKNEMIPEHKQEIFDKMREIRSSHDAWWEKLQSERHQKHLDFTSRIRANLEKNYERYRTATNALERVRSNADELRSKIESAWNDDWADRAAGWLSESEDKIRDIKNYIEQIESWIDEDERKLAH